VSEHAARWERVKHVFQAALEQPSEQRAHFLRAACDDDDPLRNEVESLLAAYGRAGDFAERPAIDAFVASRAFNVVCSHSAPAGDVFQPGLRVGPYQIVERIARGGMGEVYRAHDTRLGRVVALKVLPPHVATDRDLKQRFEREARTLATLSHPHICPVFDVGHQDGIDYFVMEHLDGETLAARLARGPLPLDQVLRYCTHIADALDKAHRSGIVHRDLKPGNIMLTKSGATLLDFGLATENHSALLLGLTTVATRDEPLTKKGTIVGTLHYMAPEQIQAKEADARSDIFSFGAVAYEMLAGLRAFDGDTSADVVAAILEREPPPLPAGHSSSPLGLLRLVKSCLEKDPDQRWQNAGDLKRELDWIRGREASPVLPATSAQRRWPLAAATLTVAALIGLAAWTMTDTVPSLSPQVSRFIVSSETPLYNLRPGPMLTLSADGKRLAFLAEHPRGGWALYVREIDQLEARMIPGSEIPPEAPATGHSPVFSRDGASIVFRSPRQGIMRVALGGGPPTKLLDDPEAWMGGVWATDDMLIAAPGSRGLIRVSASRPDSFEQLTRSTEPGGGPKRPKLLPGGQGVLFNYGAPPDSRVALLDLKTGATRILTQSGDGPIYTSSGHLVFLRGETTLMAAPFDLERLILTKEPVAVLEGVRDEDYAISENGTLAYVRAGNDTGGAAGATLAWWNRDGRVVGSAVTQPLESPRHVQISPDGKRLAMITGPEAAGDLWVHDLGGRPPLRLFYAASNAAPVWSPDSTRVAFTSGGGGPGSYTIYWLAADGSERGEPHRVDAGTPIAEPTAWLREDELLVSAFVPGGLFDVRVAAVAPDGRPRALVASGDIERSARRSPDEKWLAYESDRSGQMEIWVGAYSGGAATQVSRSGGVEPVWSRDGKELFYLRGTTMIGVKVKPEQPTFAFEREEALFEVPFRRSSAGAGGRSYDVAPDGRFLVIQPTTGANARTATSSIVVVQNWTEELKRQVPTR
jgi:serine/threonine-protein kinase